MALLIRAIATMIHAKVQPVAAIAISAALLSLEIKAMTAPNMMME